jgi:hypothetical protein
MFFTGPPTPVLPGVEQLDKFLNSMREKNALVLEGKLEESDELYESEKPL